jgi:ectoine hydroxylase-related dioxygenase (phytanoyl-CoA dioxygenase family)
VSVVTEAQRQQFEEEGYFILDSVIDAASLALLRDECQVALDRKHAEMDASGESSQGITHRGQRYFISNCFKVQPRLREFLFSELMADICRSTLGDEAFLFWEQFVVKGRQGMKFSWHQDSGYVGDPDHKPYLTCWCPLDDVSEENGTVYVLPFSHVGIRSWVKHERDPETNDKVGYFGDQRGVPVVCPAGSIAVFTSYNFHSSGPNQTDELRRVFLAQYSCEPIKKGDELWGNAEPVLVAGERQAGGIDS